MARPRDPYPTTRAGWAMYYFNLIEKNDHRIRAVQLHWFYMLMAEAERQGDIE